MLFVTQCRSVGEVVGWHSHRPPMETAYWGEDCFMRLLQSYNSIVQYMFKRKTFFFK